MDETSDPKQTTERTSPGFPGWLIWLLLSLPFVYVLSIGPVAKLSDRGLLSFPVLLAIYKPLIFIAEHVPPLKASLAWYHSLRHRILWID